MAVTNRRSNMSPQRGFTLIELLVVIAIILILIAVALPNFLDSLLRAKVAKARGDLRAIHTALEEYRLDWNAYPCESESEYAALGHFEAGLTWLTSPNQYLIQLPHDPFQGTYEQAISYELGGVEIPFQERPGGLLAMWVLHSYGPDSPEEENHTSRPNYKSFGDGSCQFLQPHKRFEKPRRHLHLRGRILLYWRRSRLCRQEGPPYRIKARINGRR